MTEKRFNVFDVDGTVFVEDHKEGSYHIGEKENVDIHCLNDIADKLNSLAEENEQLKNSDTITDLQVQIMKLKSKNKRIHEFESRYRERNLKLEKENVELKSENKELKTILKKTLKQLYNAQTSQIYEYSTNITEEEQELKEHFKEKYGKYGWKE